MFHLVWTVLVTTLLPFTRGNEECGICGAFELISNPKDPSINEVWKAMDYSNETRKNFSESSNVTLIFSKLGKVYLEEKYVSKMGMVWNDFESGKNTIFTLEDKRKIKTYILVNETQRTIKSVHYFQGFIATKLAEFNKDKLTITYLAKKRVGSLVFRELEEEQDLEYIEAIRKLAQPKDSISEGSSSPLESKGSTLGAGFVPVNSAMRL